MALPKRKRLYVDPQVQGALLYRVTLYWLVCIGLAATILACWQALTGPAQTLPELFSNLWFQYAPALVVSLLVLPLVLFDVTRISNRFVGPVFRLRQRMRMLARGERVEPIAFREGDFWLEFADEFNDILALVQNTVAAPPADRELSAAGPAARGNRPA